MASQRCVSLSIENIWVFEENVQQKYRSFHGAFTSAALAGIYNSGRKQKNKQILAKEQNYWLMLLPPLK